MGRMKQIKDYYCENCFKEHLKTWKELFDGTIVCDDKCESEINKIKSEFKPKRIRKAKEKK
jgi:hypothetical protein